MTTRPALPGALTSTSERCCAVAPRAPMTAAQSRRAAADLGVLANPVRVKLLDILVTRGDQVCVCHLEEGVTVKQPTVSHHLRILRKAGLVSSERQGLYVYYRVNRAALYALRSRISDWLERFG